MIFVVKRKIHNVFRYQGLQPIQQRRQGDSSGPRWYNLTRSVELSLSADPIRRNIEKEDAVPQLTESRPTTDRDMPHDELLVRQRIGCPLQVSFQRE